MTPRVSELKANPREGFPPSPPNPFNRNSFRNSDRRSLIVSQLHLQKSIDEKRHHNAGVFGVVGSRSAFEFECPIFKPGGVRSLGCTWRIVEAAAVALTVGIRSDYGWNRKNWPPDKVTMSSYECTMACSSSHPWLATLMDGLLAETTASLAGKRRPVNAERRTQVWARRSGSGVQNVWALVTETGLKQKLSTLISMDSPYGEGFGKS